VVPGNVDSIGYLATIHGARLYPIVQGSVIISGGPVFCFRAGTKITTPTGEIAVESLAVGDKLRVLGGENRTIQWIGHRLVNCRYHPNPEQVWPVRICRHAFGKDLPHTDLWLSPDHSIFVDDYLIPVKYLINGISIVQIHLEKVGYYHIEFDRHEIVFAEGLSCESYLDIGNRGNFINGGTVAAAFPDFSPPSGGVAEIWEGRGYAPLVVYGSALEAVRVRLLARAHAISISVSAA
jgi:hypothetical protein